MKHEYTISWNEAESKIYIDDETDDERVAIIHIDTLGDNVDIRGKIGLLQMALDAFISK